jgi:hypothetical protein
MILGVAALGPLREVVETGLGIVLALVPLGLWIAWSPGVLFAVLVTGGVCAALLIALSALEDGPTDEDGAAQQDPARVVVPDAFVEELHRLFPLVYHHSRGEKRRFRRAMETLRRLMH